MAYSVEYTETARKQLIKLPPHIRQKILYYMDDKVAVHDDPKIKGKMLSGNLAGL